MKVAFTSSTGEMIDQHFGMSDSFRIWEVGPEEAHFLETVQVGNTGEDEEDRIASRVALLGDCSIVYTMQIGGPAAADTGLLIDGHDELRSPFIFVFSQSGNVRHLLLLPQ